VQRHCVAGLQVYAFDDVDFAVRGPRRTDHPEGGPGAAAGGHVRDVGDEERAGGVGGA